MKTSKKVICLLLTLIMVVSSLPMVAFEAEAVENDLGNITVFFDENGGTGYMPYHSFTVRHYLYRGFNLPTCSFKRDGYKFIGWHIQRWSDKRWYCIAKSNGVCYYYTEEELKTKSAFTKLLVPDGYDGNVFTSDSYNDTFICYAQWEKIGKISYQANGGSGYMSDTAIIDADYVVPAKNAYTNLGHQFIGWNVFRVSDGKWFCGREGCWDWYTESRANELHLPKALIRDCEEWGIYRKSEDYIFYAQWAKYYYSSTTTLKSLPDKTLKINNKNVKFTNTQAIGVGSTYIYTVKPDTDKKNAIMYKTNKDTGNQVSMKHIRGGKKYDNITGIGYANDMSVASVNGYSTLFIATNDTASYSVVRMQVNGDTVTTTGNFNLYYNGSKVCPSGIANWGHSNGSVHFFFTSGNTVYSASIPDNQSSGNFTLTRVCYLNKTQAMINGVMRDVSSYGIQGIYYCNVNGGTLYVPVTTNNAAVILTYQRFNYATGVMYAQSPLSFEVKGASGANLNVQGCGISSDGRLYFDVNRANNGDAILYFKGYKI